MSAGVWASPALRTLPALVLLSGIGANPPSARPSPLAPRPSVTGRVAGTVTLSTALARRRPNFRIYGDGGPGSLPPQVRTDAAAELKNVVIYIESNVVAEPGSVTPNRRATMAQSGERFSPHVLPVMQGTTVEFPNEDDVYHNVFSLSSGAHFDLGRYRKGAAAKTVQFNKTGPVYVFCHIHVDMSAVVLVLGNPFFATPDQAGRYALENLPVGEYTVVAWHERIPRAITRIITVTAGQTTPLNFNIPLPESTP